ncbi:Dolichyldiphosphatase 1-like [Homarus americanus]|uniref:Dolichyldiphosphatase 1-like n=1 Tax=Homarus americanus TaxID=6706 RepID=A0A8J5N9J3_HOMAM|nr:Dolichyldiphosphatase 1-like [Homarus americanus]
MELLWKVLVAVALVTAAFIVMFSRVYLLYHSWSQVLWGALLGILLGCGWFTLTHLVLTPLFPVIASCLARQASFHELESEDIELTNENLQHLTEHSLLEDDDNDDEEITQRTQTTKRMAEAFNMIQQNMQIFIDDDSNRECSSKATAVT